jgi:hypothetical protein
MLGGSLITRAEAKVADTPSKRLIPTPAKDAAPGAFVPDQKIFEGSIALGNGLRRLSHTRGSQGSWNTAVGMNALLDASNQWGQTAVGYNALKSSGRGSSTLGTPEIFGNTAVGYNSMTVNISGVDNTAVGTNSLLNNEHGYDNTAIGINALRDNSGGGENTVAGADALLNAQHVDQLVAVGGMAGRYLSDFMTPKVRGKSSIYIGYLSSGGHVDGAENEIVIGAFAAGEGPNTVMLGNHQITDTYLKGKVHLDDDLEIQGIVRTGGVELGYRDRPRTTDGLERGKVYVTTSRVLVEAGAAAGSSYSLYNQGADPLAIAEGTGLTLRWAGSEDTGDRILAGRGLAEIWFNSPHEAVVSGTGLS